MTPGNERPILSFRGPFGLSVHVMPSILFLLAIFLVIGGMNDPIGTAIFVGVLLVSIFLHEVGHGWGCVVQGVPVDHLALHGGGGYCLPARSTTPSEDELIVAMGPIVTILLWVGASWVAPMTDGMVARVLNLFAIVNMLLAIFNLLPVFPLDGGRLFHLLMLRLLPPESARRVAGGVGFVFSILWFPLMVAAFLFIGFVFFFVPPVKMHFDMMKGRR